MRDTHSEKVVAAVVDLMAARPKILEISQEKLAEKAGLHRTTVRLIETKARRPTLLTCYRLCKALGVSLGDLIKKAEK